MLLLLMMLLHGASACSCMDGLRLRLRLTGWTQTHCAAGECAADLCGLSLLHWDGMCADARCGMSLLQSAGWTHWTDDLSLMHRAGWWTHWTEGFWLCVAAPYSLSGLLSLV